MLFLCVSCLRRSHLAPNRLGKKRTSTSIHGATESIGNAKKSIGGASSYPSKKQLPNKMMILTTKIIHVLTIKYFYGPKRPSAKPALFLLKTPNQRRIDPSISGVTARRDPSRNRTSYLVGPCAGRAGCRHRGLRLRDEMSESSHTKNGQNRRTS